MLFLLMNGETMKDLESAVELIIIVTCSKLTIDSTCSSVGKLNIVLKCFKHDVSSQWSPLGGLSQHTVGQSDAEYTQHVKKNPKITHN